MDRFRNASFSSQVAALCAAFVAPLVALLCLHFGGVSTSSTLTAVFVVFLAVCLVAGIVAVRSILFIANEMRCKLNNICRTRPVIEYKPDGTILWANEQFEKTVGYKLSEMAGRHHSMFVDPEYAKSAEYVDFWRRLARGEFIEQRYKRQGANGKIFVAWTNYTPIFNAAGVPYKIVNWMTDFTGIHQEQVQAISGVAAGLKKLASGDLTARIDTELQSDYDQLRIDFNAALEHLQQTIKSVLQGTDALSTGAGEISQAADDLSRRTEQQAASLEETAAALEEITATVKKTAANAKEARGSVTSAKEAAEEGGNVVGTAITAMDAIAQSSKQITDIIGVIDEIAFQTNLLALNAGVEAARAGDAGRGFAVVASEVRALAQRSSEAAKQIKTLINASGQQVESGVKLVGESGAALRHIMDQVQQINALVTEMAQAAEQQSTGIEEVNSAVAQMDQVTQQNAAMVEQSTAASRNLADETKSLQDLVGSFNVGAVAQTARPAAPRTKTAAPRINLKPPRRVAAAGGRAPARAVQDDWTEF